MSRGCMKMQDLKWSGTKQSLIILSLLIDAVELFTGTLRCKCAYILSVKYVFGTKYAWLMEFCKA